MMPLWLSTVPLLLLAAGIVAVLYTKGADAVQTLAQPLLLAAGLSAIVLSAVTGRRLRRPLRISLFKAASQVLPALPILLLIATVSASWMFSGVVPTLICYGLDLLNPTMFLVTTCCVCAAVSVLSGSSWTTIATIGVAFMGVGAVWHINPAMTAGAIISGAYFGDKISPLSDTTVLAAATCGVPLATHIRYMLITTVPAMTLAVAVFAICGIGAAEQSTAASTEIDHALRQTFHITPLTLIIPAATMAVMAMRPGTLVTLAASTAMGVAGMLILQPQVTAQLAADGSTAGAIVRLLATDTSLPGVHPLLADLVATSGMKGMIPTITLVLSAMIFGAAMMASGMLFSITHAITRRLRRRESVVASTVASGLMLNSCTGDQYLSIILGGNLYRNLYQRRRLEPRLLSRTIEDSTSVTSVLIPWNSCGLTQSTVLGVATLTYLPFCIFNIASPLMSIIVAWTGIGIRSGGVRAQAPDAAKA